MQREKCTHCFLVREDIPNTVAREQKELVLLRKKRDHRNIGLRCDNLLVTCDRLHLLILEVTDGSRKVQVSVDPSHGSDKSTGLLDSGELSLLERLVVKR